MHGTFVKLILWFDFILSHNRSTISGEGFSASSAPFRAHGIGNSAGAPSGVAAQPMPMPVALRLCDTTPLGGSGELMAHIDGDALALKYIVRAVSAF